MASTESIDEPRNEEATTKKWEKKLPANVGTLPQGEDVFKDYLIDDWHFLDEIDQRSLCPKCSKSRKYFCYTCYVPVTELTGKIPYVKLPIKVDIVKHRREIDGKSTAAHAAVLAPDDVSIHTYPCIPDYEESPGKVVLVFPGKNATSIGDYVRKLRTENSFPPDSKKPRLSSSQPIERAVFIDSTWNQCRGIYKDARLKGLPCVVLQERISQFWRHQEGSPRWYLATVEAVHQLLLELRAASQEPLGLEAPSPGDTGAANPEPPSPNVSEPGGLGSVDTQSATSPNVSEQHGNIESSKASPSECHDYDNLLFFFRFMYDKIHRLYEPETLQAYKRPLTL